MSKHIDPEREQVEAFKELPRDKPIMMLNLVRYREQAAYEDGTQATGAEAYATYGKAVGPILAGVGGEVVWRGNPKTTLIGPQDEYWDETFVVRYPSANAFLEMISSPEYQVAVKHRQAAVEDSRLIRTEE